MPDEKSKPIGYSVQVTAHFENGEDKVVHSSSYNGCSLQLELGWDWTGSHLAEGLSLTGDKQPNQQQRLLLKAWSGPRMERYEDLQQGSVRG